MCPPGVDQTCRTAQRWRVIAPELCQIIDLGRDQYPKRDHIDDNSSIDIFGLLARPVIDTVPVQKTRAQQSKSSENGKSIFQRLSTELLVMIMDNLDGNKKDLVCLALSSQHLFEHLVYRVQAQYRRNVAPWANTRLVQQGNYSITLPESFVKEGLLEQFAPPLPVFSRNRMPAARRFFWAFSESHNPVSINQESADWLSVADENLKTAGLSDKIWESLRQELKCPDFFPKDRTWILRNLSKHEFISSDSMSVKIKKQARKKSVPMRLLNFADLLMMRICWTSMPNIPGWGRGEEEWAGDRFDIVTMDSHRKDEDTTAWKDVSEEVVREAVKTKNFWSDEYDGYL